MSFFQELKRRNVIRVAILYAVSSWVLLQLTDVLASLLTLPPWAGSFVIFLLLLGLFPALAFSWVYELTSEGLKREKDIDRSTSIAPDTGKKINSVIVVLLIIAIVSLAADRLMPEAEPLADSQENSPVREEISPNTIAVLPFADMSAEGDQQYFTDGLSEELLNLLVRVDGLTVASRTTAFGFRDTTLGLREVAKALGVAHILEGSVRKSGDRIRITAQLIDADSDAHLWSDTFDRELTDIFAIQDEIGSAIVDALKEELGLEVDAVNVVASTENVDAYALYLEARELFVKRQDLTESIGLFHQAIELDAGFAKAWEGLAAVEIVADDWIWDDDIAHAPLALVAATTALELDPSLSLAYAVLGSYERAQTGNQIESMRNLDIALKNDPKNTTALHWKGIGLNLMGFFDGAIESHSRCLEIDPGYLNCQQFLAYAYLEKGMTDKALEIYEPTLEHNYHSLSDTFVSVYVRKGQRVVALLLADLHFRRNAAPVIEWIRAIEDPEANQRVAIERFERWEAETGSEFGIGSSAMLMLALGEYERVSTNSGALHYGWHPDAKAYRATVHFKTAIREFGVLKYWQEKGFPDFCRAVGDDDYECDDPN